MKRIVVLLAALSLAGCATAPATFSAIGATLVQVGGIASTVGSIATGIGGALVKDSSDIVTTPLSLLVPEPEAPAFRADGTVEPAKDER